MKKQIPNILSGIRLLMVPLFAWLMFYEDAEIWALATFLGAMATDVVDGYLARRNNWITDLGKILDPLADKLMQIAAFVCLAIKNKFLIFLAVIVIAKEVIFLLIGLVVKSRSDIVLVAKWYGKMATAVITFCVCVLILWWDVKIITYICAGASAAVMLFSSVMYGIYYAKQIKSSIKG